MTEDGWLCLALVICITVALCVYFIARAISDRRPKR